MTAPQNWLKLAWNFQMTLFTAKLQNVIIINDYVFLKGVLKCLHGSTDDKIQIYFNTISYLL